MGSAIARIVDYTAQVAAGLPGVTAVFGVGEGTIGDPLRPGQTIQAAPDAPTAPMTHWSDLPKTTRLDRVTQDGMVEYIWDLPMRFWLGRADLANMRRTALPLYDGYLHAFMADPTLGGHCLLATPNRFELGDDEVWAWLDVNLEVTELVAY